MDLISLEKLTYSTPTLLLGSLAELVPSEVSAESEREDEERDCYGSSKLAAGER